MVEEGLLKNTIDPGDLLNADIFISLAPNSVKIGLSKTNNNLAVLEEINYNSHTSFWDLVSFPPQDLETCDKVKLLTHSEVYTLVPSSLYNEDHKIDYLHQLTEVDNDKPVISEYLSIIDAYLLFQASSRTWDILNSLPTHTVISHYSAVMINYEMKRLKSSKDIVFVHFESNSFNCMLVKDQKLAYSNRLEFITASDAIYYILGIYQHHNLDPNEVEIVISGKIMPYSELHNILLRFIHKLSWFKTPEEITLGAIGITKSDHLFADIIRYSACV